MPCCAAGRLACYQLPFGSGGTPLTLGSLVAVAVSRQHHSSAFIAFLGFRQQLFRCRDSRLRFSASGSEKVRPAPCWQVRRGPLRFHAIYSTATLLVQCASSGFEIPPLVLPRFYARLAMEICAGGVASDLSLVKDDAHNRAYGSLATLLARRTPLGSWQGWYSPPAKLFSKNIPVSPGCHVCFRVVRRSIDTPFSNPLHTGLPDAAAFRQFTS